MPYPGLPLPNIGSAMGGNGNAAPTSSDLLQIFLTCTAQGFPSLPVPIT